MREFNTSGPCNPALHYTVLRESLMQKGLEKVRKGRYFTIFAPRQTGKTTYFQLLMKELARDGFLPVWVSFENFKTLEKHRFYHALNSDMTYELKRWGLETLPEINDAHDLQATFSTHRYGGVKLVMVIDEFEGTPESVLSELMHTFRKMYHQKEQHCLHSLILVGVSTIAELVISHASPFNIADELEVPYFTFDEVEYLIGQYVGESGQAFESEVIRAVYENTNGQPGLVCGMCRHLVEISPDSQLPVAITDFFTALQYFLTKKLDKNIANVVQKARQKRNFMIRLLFSEEPLPFLVDDPDIAFLYANGVIDEKDGQVHIPVPLYAKRLINAFRPLVNGETQHYVVTREEMLGRYLTDAGGLDLDALLEEYRSYVRRRGFRAFDARHLREAAWHYSLDGFITFFIQCLGGQTLVEVPSGKGRTDILILHGDKKYIIETKRYVNHHYFQHGKSQLAQYLISEKLNTGYYVVFSRLHTDRDTLFTRETVLGRQINTHIIPVAFEQPSRMEMPEELKLSREEIIAANLIKTGALSPEEIAGTTGVRLERVRALQELFGEEDDGGVVQIP
ncbi:MAG: AAA-like domain-containing protein [Desulfamplus sp.]|nr:AAA-like domain-containing protein [Desulfamplus sp.]